MGILVEQSTYGQFFAEEILSEKIQDASYPVVKRSPAKSLDGNSWLQKGSLSPYIEHGEVDEIWERRTHLTTEEIELYKTPTGIVELNREGIELALDRRVALFFQQSILCYKMPFVFSTQGADDQIGSAKAIHLSNQGQKGGTVHKREAAHSSTIPTLLARPKNDVESPTFVYLKGGSSHAQHNATIGMHIDVNGADELLDGKGDQGLRSTAVKILNLVADGLDPVKATNQFLKAFETRAQETAQKLETHDTRKAVLEAYVQGVQNIAQNIETDRRTFDRLIGVKIDNQEDKLREIIYQRRYDIIRLEEVVESRIGKRIDAVKKEMNARDRSFLEYILLKEFAETNQRKILEKLLAKTAAIFEEQYAQKISKKENTSFKSFQTRVKNLQTKYAEILDNLNRDLRSDFRELSSSEFAFRAQVFKDLRTRVRNWTQKEFCERYYETTGKKVSQTWVSRMEQPTRVDTKPNYQTPIHQRTRSVSLMDARDCAATFGIDVGLFLPCLITSTP